MRPLSLLLCVMLADVCLGGGLRGMEHSPPLACRGKPFEYVTAQSKEKDPKLREAAAIVLADFGAQAILVLMVLLKDKEDDVCWAAVESLRKIGPEAQAAVADLTKLLHDRDWNLRHKARKALAKITKK